MATMVALVFGGVFPWLRDVPAHPAVFAIAAAFAALGAVAPGLLRWPYRLWLRIGSILGAINSRIILAAIFFAVLTPMAVMRRLVKRTAGAGRSAGAALPAYRISKAADASPKSMERPF